MMIERTCVQSFVGEIHRREMVNEDQLLAKQIAVRCGSTNKSILESADRIKRTSRVFFLLLVESIIK